MQFYKMQSLGNDFVVFGNPFKTDPPKHELITQICNRHYGVGCDCAISIERSCNCDYRMRVYNPNGYEAEICGNAIKCSARYVYERGFFKKRSFIVETNSGARLVTVDNSNIYAEIGRAVILEHGTLSICGFSLDYHLVSMGNPHCVIFTNGITDDEFYALGPIIEQHHYFPNGTNVEFAQVIDEHNINMRVWERGIGETLSCVTGSCACVSVAIAFGWCSDSSLITVHQKGGDVVVETKSCGSMYVNGNCQTVFKGTLI